MQEFINALHLGNTTFSYALSGALQVLFVLLVTLACSYGIHLFLKRLQLKLQKTVSPWDDAVVMAMKVPVQVLVVIVGLTFAAGIIYSYTELPLLSHPGLFRNIGIIFAVSWFLFNFIRLAEKQGISQLVKKNKEFDPKGIHLVAKLLYGILIMAALLLVMDALGIDIKGLLAIGGISGVTLGFAAKDVLANLFGSLMVSLDRPFAIGDWVRSPDRNIEGRVEHIGWKQTRIRTLDMRPIYVPNAIFSTIILENSSRMSHRRVYEIVKIEYKERDKILPLLEAIKEQLKQHPEIDPDKPISVHIETLDMHSVSFFVSVFVQYNTDDAYHVIRESILFLIRNTVETYDAKILSLTSK